MHVWQESFERRWRSWRAMPVAERLLLAEVALALALARMAVILVAFRRLASWLVKGHDGGVGGRVSDLQIDRLRGALARVAPLAPWRSGCMEQALAACYLLRRRGVASTLYLGVSKSDNALEAHAWLKADGAFVVGEFDKERFTPVASFGPEPR